MRLHEVMGEYEDEGRICEELGGIHLLKSGYRQFAYSYALSPLRGLRWPYNLV